MSTSIDEHPPIEKPDRFTSLPAFRLLYITETTLTLMSAVSMGYFVFFRPLNYDWLSRFANFEMGIIYLGFVCMGFAVSIVSIYQTRTKVSVEEPIQVSMVRTLILSTPAFAIINVLGGLLLTIILNGSLASIVLSMFLFYGYGIGFFLSYSLSIPLGLRKWQLARERNTRRITLSSL